MTTEAMPDLSHLTEEERKIIEEVLQRQKAEENKEQQVQQKYEKELEEIEKQINERKENAMRLIGTQEDAICQICQKTKFADGIGHKCYYCQLRSCARCGGKMQIKTKSDQAKTPGTAASKAQPQKQIWACSLCQKRQQILGKTGKWFHKDAAGGIQGSGSRATTPTGLSPTGTPTPTTQGPPSMSQPNGAPGGMNVPKQPFTLQQPHPPSQQHQMQQMATSRGSNQPSQQRMDERDRQEQRPQSPPTSQRPNHERQERDQDRQPSNHQAAQRPRQSVDRRPPNEVEKPERRREEYPRSASPGLSSDRQPADRRRSTERRQSATQLLSGSSTPRSEEQTPNGGGRRRPSDRYPDQAQAPPESASRERRRRPSVERLPASEQRRGSREYYDEPVQPREAFHGDRPRDDRPSSPAPTSVRSEVRSARQRSRSPPFRESASTGNGSPSTSRRSRRTDERGYEEDAASPRYERPRTPPELQAARVASRERTSERDDRYKERDRNHGRERDFDRDRERDFGRDADYGSREHARTAESHSGAKADYAYDSGDRRSTSRPRDDHYDQPTGRRTPTAQEPYPRKDDRTSGKTSPFRTEEYSDDRYEEEQRPQERQHSRSRDSSRRTSSEQRRAAAGPPENYPVQPSPRGRRSAPEEEYDQHSRRKILPTVAPPFEEEPRPAPSSTPRQQQRHQPEPRVHERRRLPEPEEILRAGAAAAAAAASAQSSATIPHGPTPASRPVRHSPQISHRQLETTSSAAYRRDSLSSDAEIIQRPGPIGTAAGMVRGSPTNAHYHHHHHHHHAKTHYAVGGVKHKIRLPHNKQRSFSSSDDEIASTSECPSCEELESETYSDRGSVDRYSKLNSRYLPTASAPGAADVAAAQLFAVSGRQLSVTWQPSADSQRMIGHMILRRAASASLGLKVVGGRPTPSGRLGAFVTKVKRGSVAEVVGHLRPGDEVLEWNGRELQNASFDEVCDVINESKHDPQVELIVSRPIAGLASEYGMRGTTAKYSYSGSVVGSSILPHEIRVSFADNDVDGCSQLETALEDVPIDDESIMDDGISSIRPESSISARARNEPVWTKADMAMESEGRCNSLEALLACTRRTFMLCPVCCMASENEHMNDVISRADTLSLQKQAQQLSSAGPLGGVVTVQPSSTVTGAPTFIPGQPPVVMITAPSMGTGESQMVVLPPPGGVMRNALPQQAKGQIFGRIQIALVYSPADQQLVVTIYQSMDLPPRNDGSARNPYVKMFLLPDRSEKSRRQSKTLASTCQPMWQQSFIYQSVTQMDLATRVLEVTLWDYDKYATNEFLGEVLFDLASSLLDNEPRWYTLTDMDEESPIRLKLRHLRLSAYANQQAYPPLVPGSDANALGDSSASFFGRPPSYSGATAVLQAGTDPLGEDLQRNSARVAFLDQQPSDQQTTAGITRSRTYYRPRHPEMVNQDELDDLFSGYYSDHGHRSRALRRLPRNAATAGTKGIAITATGETYDIETGETAAENLAEDIVYDADGNVLSASRRHLPRLPADIYGEEAMRELGDKAQQIRSQGSAGRRHHSGRTHRPSVQGVGANRRHIPRIQYDPLSPPNDHNLPGYLSDGSETSMSITSTQSERPRTRTHQEFQNSLEAAPEETEPYDGQDGTMSDSAVGGPGGQSAKSVGFAVDAKRKKSIMTRLIPGRTGSAMTLAEQNKRRMGFPRSEEVGVPAFASTLPCRLSVGGKRAPLVEQGSVESQGSVSSESSLWLPVVPGDGPLGEFVAGLGPGQVVGRQALASPCLGEIQLVMGQKGGSLEIKVIRARSLVKKPGAKYNPAPYVKVYLMEGKYCVAKAKTGVAARTAEPRFDQHLVFNETYKGRLLQISVWGDYGRMERKVPMGISMIRLDILETNPRTEGWYKLYHSSSLVGTSSPARKESQGPLGVDQSAGV